MGKNKTPINSAIIVKKRCNIYGKIQYQAIFKNKTLKT